jgi:hypothetical protein
LDNLSLGFLVVEDAAVTVEQAAPVSHRETLTL